jgi:hypothetical protein
MTLREVTECAVRNRKWAKSLMVRAPLPMIRQVQSDPQSELMFCAFPPIVMWRYQVGGVWRLVQVVEFRCQRLQDPESEVQIKVAVVAVQRHVKPGHFDTVRAAYPGAPHVVAVNGEGLKEQPGWSAFGIEWFGNDRAASFMLFGLN